MSKVRYAVDEVQNGNYIRCWRTRASINVQIWLKKETPDGEPDGDWEMPKVLGFSTAIAQAVLQTEE